MMASVWALYIKIFTLSRRQILVVVVMDAPFSLSDLFSSAADEYLLSFSRSISFVIKKQAQIGTGTMDQNKTRPYTRLLLSRAVGRGSNDFGRGRNDLGRGMLKYKLSNP